MNLLVPIAVAGGVFALVKLSKSATPPPGTPPLSDQPGVGDGETTTPSPTTNPQVIIDPVRAGGSGGAVPDVVGGTSKPGHPGAQVVVRKPEPRDHRDPVGIPPKPAPVQCIRAPCHANPVAAGTSRTGSKYDSPTHTSAVLRSMGRAPVVY
jgi:hypothetical protein